VKLCPAIRCGTKSQEETMGWRHDEKKARKVAGSDPAEALQLVDAALDGARDSSICGSEHLCDLLVLKAESADAAGRAEVAQATRAELTAIAEAAIAERDAVAADPKASPMKIAGALEAKSRYLERLGRRLDADRTILHAADFQLAAVGDAGAKAGLAATPAYVLAHGAMGLEFGSQFERSFEKSLRSVAESWREPLLKDGRAIALAYCERCGEVVEADQKKRCPEKHKLDGIRVVVVEDADAVRGELESAHKDPAAA
jgi:hypothetical protein